MLAPSVLRLLIAGSRDPRPQSRICVKGASREPSLVTIRQRG